MQPFIVVLIFFAVCLAYGIHRAMLDVRQEAKQEALQALHNALGEFISKTTGLSEAFMGLAKSTETANESIKRFSVLFPHYGWPLIDNKAPVYLSKDCVS